MRIVGHEMQIMANLRVAPADDEAFDPHRDPIWGKMK
jgi:hypothetical protein